METFNPQDKLNKRNAQIEETLTENNTDISEQALFAAQLGFEVKIVKLDGSSVTIPGEVKPLSPDDTLARLK